ncbi:hypothetical protein EJ05DRAFT_494087 [Pseudovirgaria hyperparasitica]|uniref:Glycosyltransferase family 31 protein n=1 Tax=Pseudovirgaria hyperparasitica TaxID=470096 RepID=A0A6A6W0U1_9PEZI|nr:uncharacterized protein EJ05DRAFT_494087 [Pseudovirgaria hyperparasitica]KAF2755759.1 hypothetical protein EJ05DRAFT_494087 [Pseudovirgaria hyperparasitica]
MVKTGSCEINHKLPIHLHTSLRCIPSYAIFSDHQDEFHGIEVHDAFEGQVSQKIMYEYEEFHMYRKMKDVGGCSGLNATDVVSKGIANINGNSQNRGWMLDRFKFLPILRQAYQYRPEAKWYVLIETDATFVWPNLHDWLQHLDPNLPYYLGSQTQIGTQQFAQGGAGTIISNAAMKRVVEHFEANQTSLENFTADHWAGDCVLGKAFEDIGIKLLWSWPHLLTESIADIDYTDDKYFKRLWCTPVLSYHHMTSEQTWDHWKFQRRWFEHNPGRVLKHCDVFYNYVLPQLQYRREAWDNESDGLVEVEKRPRSSQECKDICLDDPDCLQYRYSADGCRMSTRFRLGQIAASNRRVVSGWILDRVENMAANFTSCSAEEATWVTEFYGWS